MRMVSPETVTVPDVGVSRRLMQRRKVDLPEPDEPRIEMTSPSRASSEMPLTPSFPPKLLRRFSTFSATGALGDTLVLTMPALRRRARRPAGADKGSAYMLQTSAHVSGRS